MWRAIKQIWNMFLRSGIKCKNVNLGGKKIRFGYKMWFQLSVSILLLFWHGIPTAEYIWVRSQRWAWFCYHLVTRQVHLRDLIRMRLWNWPWLVQIMACRLSDAKPYLNHCWIIVYWTLGNIFCWNLDQNTRIFIQENEFENVWKIVTIFSWSQWVKRTV